MAREGDYPDALYLKADILWQGFADRQQAIICLNRLMENRKASKTMYNWAKSYCRRLQQLDDQNFRMPVAADSDVAMRKHVTSDRSS